MTPPPDGRPAPIALSVIALMGVVAVAVPRWDAVGATVAEITVVVAS